MNTLFISKCYKRNESLISKRLLSFSYHARLFWTKALCCCVLCVPNRSIDLANRDSFVAICSPRKSTSTSHRVLRTEVLNIWRNAWLTDYPAGHPVQTDMLCKEPLWSYDVETTKIKGNCWASSGDLIPQPPGTQPSDQPFRRLDLHVAEKHLRQQKVTPGSKW
jgi:hypothetical protein